MTKNNLKQLKAPSPKNNKIQDNIPATTSPLLMGLETRSVKNYVWLHHLPCHYNTYTYHSYPYDHIDPNKSRTAKSRSMPPITVLWIWARFILIITRVGLMKGQSSPPPCLQLHTQKRWVDSPCDYTHQRSACMICKCFYKTPKAPT